MDLFEKDWTAYAATACSRDICAGRSRGNKESHHAYKRALPGMPQSRRTVLDAVKAAGPAGITCKELAARLGLGANHISGRFTELKTQGAIEPTGEKREGSMAMRAGENTKASRDDGGAQS
jgi:hypothetical protein